MRCETQEQFTPLKELQQNPSFFLQESILQWYYTDKSGTSPLSCFPLFFLLMLRFCLFSVSHCLSDPLPSNMFMTFDSAGQEQGPFWNDEMAEWWADALLTPDLLVRRKGERDSVPINGRRSPCAFARLPHGSALATSVPVPPMPWAVPQTQAHGMYHYQQAPPPLSSSQVEVASATAPAYRPLDLPIGVGDTSATTSSDSVPSTSSSSRPSAASSSSFASPSAASAPLQPYPAPPFMPGV